LWEHCSMPAMSGIPSYIYCNHSPPSPLRARRCHPLSPSVFLYLILDVSHCSVMKNVCVCVYVCSFCVITLLAITCLLHSPVPARFAIHL
jgi:hypothetical protein